MNISTIWTDCSPGLNFDLISPRVESDLLSDHLISYDLSGLNLISWVKSEEIISMGGHLFDKVELALKNNVNGYIGRKGKEPV